MDFISEETLNKGHKRLKELLAEEEYAHAVSTAEMARETAPKFGIDPDRAYAAGLFHDWCKCMPGRELIRKIMKYDSALIWEYEEFPKTVHQVLGAFEVQEELGLTDPDVLSAMRKHTTANGKMTDLDKLIYVIDKIEPLRDYPGVENYRQMIVDGKLDQCFKVMLRDSIRRLIEDGKPVSLRSFRAWNTACRIKD